MSNALYGWGELVDGTRWDGIRITLPTKIAFERSARANRWDADEQPFTAQAFWSWHAAKLVGRHDLPWEGFLEHVVDAGVTKDAPGDVEAVDPSDPTRPGAITG